MPTPITEPNHGSPNTDDSLPLNQIARYLPGRRKPHKSTIHRWRTRGVRGIRLKTCLVAGRRYTRIGWVKEFLDAINAAANGSPVPGVLAGHREREIRAAESELQAEGI